MSGRHSWPPPTKRDQHASDCAVHNEPALPRGKCDCQATVLPSPGSSVLTPEQQDWYANKYGVRYLTVQEQPFRPSRRVRRGRGTGQDMAVLEGQRAAWDALSKIMVTPAPEPDTA